MAEPIKDEDRTLESVRARYESGSGWPPGVHYATTARADAIWLIRALDDALDTLRIARDDITASRQRAGLGLPRIGRVLRGDFVDRPIKSYEYADGGEVSDDDLA